MTIPFDKLRVAVKTAERTLDLTLVTAGATSAYEGAVYVNGGVTLRINVIRSTDADALALTASLTLPDDAAPLDPDFALTVTLPAPDWDGVKWMADCLNGQFWCHPVFGDDLRAVPPETQGLIMATPDGFIAASSVCAGKFSSRVMGGENGVSVALRSGMDTLRSVDGEVFLLLAEGEDAVKTASAAVDFGIALSGGRVKRREDRRYPALFEYLGWCSWDALEVRVSEAGILEKCAEFKRKGIPVRWLIVDDMWADVPDLRDPVYHNRGEMFGVMHHAALAGFGADEKRFPHGLDGGIAKIKEKYGVAVGMWHPTTGYWAGIAPGSPLAREFSDVLTVSADGTLVPAPETSAMFGFYNAWHGWLKGCGVDFMKIDNQSSLRRVYRGLKPVGEAAKNLHTAVEASVAVNFDGALINCMGMAAENMWSRPQSAVSRASDDFQPDDRPWFAKHVRQCVYNSIFQGRFHVCDYDMWWSGDPQGVKNSLLRAVSGGPVYVSDRIGESVAEVLEPLHLPDGRVLRADVPAVPAPSCVLDDPCKSGRPFIAVSHSGRAGLAAAFNLDTDGAPVRGELSPSDFGIYKDEEKFAVYAHFAKRLSIIGAGETLPVELDGGGDFEYYNVIPVENGAAVVGITEKLNAPLAVEKLGGGVYRARCAGTLKYYAEGAGEICAAVAENELITVKGQ